MLDLLATVIDLFELVFRRGKKKARRDAAEAREEVRGA